MATGKPSQHGAPRGGRAIAAFGERAGKGTARIGHVEQLLLELTGRAGSDCEDPPVCITAGVDASVGASLAVGVGVGGFGLSVTVVTWGCEGTYDKGSCESEEDTTDWECETEFLDIIP